MDYKKTVDTLKWHAIYSELNGAEARVMTFIASSANYKTSKLMASYNELAQAVSLSKASVAKAIASLVEKKALAVDEAASGRMQATYRVRGADELTEYFSIEESNPEAERFESEEDRLFGGVISKLADVGADCDECQEGKRCTMHEYQAKRIEDSQEYRDYKMWLFDNSKPPRKIKTILGKPSVSDE